MNLPNTVPATTDQPHNASNSGGRAAPEPTETIAEPTGSKAEPLEVGASGDGTSAETTTVSSASPFTQDGPTQTPWLDFVSLKKMSGKAFLSRLNKDGRVPVPSPHEKTAFSMTVTESKDGFGRLLGLIHAVPASKSALREMVIFLAEAAAARELQLDEWPKGPDAVVERRIGRWLDLRAKRPLIPRDLHAFYVFLHLARDVNKLEEDATFRLARLAVTPHPKVSRAKKDTGSGTPKKKGARRDLVELTAGDTIVSAAPPVPALTLLCNLHDAEERARAKLVDRVTQLEARVEELTSRILAQEEVEASLQSQVGELTTHREDLLGTVTNLEERLAQTEDGYRHRLQEVRGRVRGVMEGQLTRWIQTALHASQENPPWTNTIQERLEEALTLIEKESKWLRPSA
jgi:hypothetical protein